MARPTMSSDVPSPYTFAVSQNVMPSSTACRKMGLPHRHRAPTSRANRRRGSCTRGAIRLTFSSDDPSRR